MKKSILLLVAIFGILASPVFADSTAQSDSQTEASPNLSSSDSSTEAISVNREAACKTGFCPAPIDSKQATLVDRMRSKQLVDWIMGDGKGAPPEITNSETHK
jgi:hypothetical protein